MTITNLRTLTASERAEHLDRLRSQAVTQAATITQGGSVLIDCPHCIREGTIGQVDVTRFVDGWGKRTVSVSCRRGHSITFRGIDEWREERQAFGLQRRV